MASAEILDFEKLTAPISEEAPAGAELKDDPSLSVDYYNVKDARERARALERQAFQAAFADDDEAVSVEPPDWRKVYDLSLDILAEKSKDLWVAGWLIEALTRMHGYPGLRDGFRLVRELAERYWDGIHPVPDEDGIATTVAQLSGLNGEGSEGALIGPIALIPITVGTSVGPFSGSDYVDAAELESLTDPDRRNQRIEQGVPTLSMFETAVNETPVEFFVELLEDINAALEEFNQMNDVLEEKCGKNDEGYSQAPPSSNIANALKEAADQVRSIAARVMPIEEEEEEAVDGDSSGELVAVGQGGQAAETGRVTTREDAFKVLTKVADFFRKTEPHSPVSFALDQAVRWGRMSLPDLLRELIADETARDELFKRTGIPGGDDAEE